MGDSVLICDERLTVTHDNLIGLLKRRIEGMGTWLSAVDRFRLALFTQRRADDDRPVEEQEMQSAYAVIGIEPIDQRCRMTVIMHHAPDDLLPYPTKDLLIDLCASLIYACDGRERRDAWEARQSGNAQALGLDKRIAVRVKRGMSQERKDRATLWKVAHESCPELSMSEVARKVLKDTRDSIRVELEHSGRQWAKTDLESAIDSEIERRYGKAQFNVSTVDNDYGAMGWKWLGSAVISKLPR